MKFDYLKEVMGGRLEGGADVSGDGEVIAGKCRMRRGYEMWRQGGD